MCRVKCTFTRDCEGGCPYPSWPHPQPSWGPALLGAGVRTLAPGAHLRPAGRKMMSHMFPHFFLISSSSFFSYSFKGVFLFTVFKTSAIFPKLSCPQVEGQFFWPSVNIRSHWLFVFSLNFHRGWSFFFPRVGVRVWGSSPAFAISREALETTGY